MFKLIIDLGNSGMFTAADVAEALRRVADKIRGVEGEFELADAYDRHQSIRDSNGNDVGHWQVIYVGAGA